MVKNISAPLLLLIAIDQKSQVVGGCAENVRLNSPCSEKSRAIAGPELGDKEGIKALFRKKILGIVSGYPIKDSLHPS